MIDDRTVPFVDLISIHKELESALLEVCKKSFETAGFIGGPEVEGFEREFAQFCGTKYSVGVSSGTDALRFALQAAGIRPGEIVITVPHTFIATAEAICQAGARPEFVDIDSRTFNMDPEKLRAYLKTQCAFDPIRGQYIQKAGRKPVTAVVPVHLYGQMADMDAILEIADEYNLIVVEDACQAHGAEYFSEKRGRWVKAGSMGRAAGFSFYPGKNLGACGEGGAVTTDDPEIARKVAMLRDHGQAKKYYHEVEGHNGRLDALQAGILRVKLRHLAQWNLQRQEAARIYDSLLSPFGGTVITPYQASTCRSVYHLYVIRTQFRDCLLEHLGKSGIGTGIHYPVPVHLQAAYRSMNWKVGDFPVTESAAGEILSLPMFAGITSEQQERIADTISQFANAYVAQ
ncbi:MAG: DegT/DnrJ/EryC1/StrS family aminotransferase [Candidatus Acidiferrales bacterium]